MKSVSALCLLLLLFIAGAVPAGAAPTLVYSTPLGWDDVAIDSIGNAYALSGHFVTKLSPLGELIFQRQVELRSQWPLAIAIDPAGYIYIAGTANFADPREVGSEANDAYEAFVAKLTPDGTGVIYETFFMDPYTKMRTHGLDLAVDAFGRAYLRYITGYEQYVAVVSFSPEGSFSRFWGGRKPYVTAMALGPFEDLFTVGWVLGDDDPNNKIWEVYLGKESSSGALIETLVDASETFDWWSVDVAATPGGGSVVVGTKGDGLYVAEFGPMGEKIFSRVLNLGEAEIRDVAVTSSGQIVLAGSTRSGVLWDAFILRLAGGSGEVISSMTLGGSGNDHAESVAAGPWGDIYVAGSTNSPDFPAVNALQPFSGSNTRFLTRITENRPPDCSGATASPSVIWPANGKMVPVSILGVTDPEGDGVALKVTGISQDEPGAAFSGIGSSVAQIKAERDGKGDGRVYRIQFEASDPSGGLCTGELRVCVPHDQGKGGCVDSH